MWFWTCRSIKEFFFSLFCSRQRGDPRQPRLGPDRAEGAGCARAVADPRRRRAHRDRTAHREAAAVHAQEPTGEERLVHQV